MKVLVSILEFGFNDLDVVDYVFAARVKHGFSPAKDYKGLISIDSNSKPELFIPQLFLKTELINRLTPYAVKNPDTLTGAVSIQTALGTCSLYGFTLSDYKKYGEHDSWPGLR